MALHLSPSMTITATSSHTNPLPFFSTTTRSLTQNPSLKLLRIGAKHGFSPLRVAAPPSVPPSDQQETLKDEYKIDDEFGDESKDSKFSWRDHWYPVSLIEDLDQKLPTPFQLLGRDLVIWFDVNDKQWVAFDDKCPHRLAPLSVYFAVLCLVLLFTIVYLI